MTVFKGQDESYKIRLVSGRILGPMDLERIKLFILKNQITGIEEARYYPNGDWVNINQIPEIADLILANIQGKLKKEPRSSTSSSILSSSPPYSPTTLLPGANQVLNVEDLKSSAYSKNDHEKTVVGVLKDSRDNAPQNLTKPEESNQVSQEKTVFLKMPSQAPVQAKKKKRHPKELIKQIAIGIILGIVGYQLFLAEPEKPLQHFSPFRPQLPSYKEGQADPKQSEQAYQEAMTYYLADTIEGYKKAAKKFMLSASYDINNVKTLAMLASTYLNLIDASNKDENYFSVISKLIEMSRAIAIDLPQTVYADVEFYLIIKKAEAAQNRIIEYTKSHSSFDLEMYYYLALVFFEKGNAVVAAKYLSHLPDNKIKSAKIFFLRGNVAEKLGDIQSALLEYQKAITLNPNHAKSHLRIAAIMNQRHTQKELEQHLELLLSHPTLLTPRDLAQAYYFHALLLESRNKLKEALVAIERAIKLESENHEYLLELYTLRGKRDDTHKKFQGLARMYFFLGEGEKLVQSGKYQDALNSYLQARQANSQSPIPLIKTGDMFNYLHDIEHAKMNYKLAADLAPQDISVWSKYINALIQSFEWDEATKAMDKFRKLPVNQSSIDKAAADMYQKQGRFIDAQTFYRKAMARDAIDSEVYIEYAKSLMSTKNYRDAPFFFALALRFDPLNLDAIINTAKCLAETESIDRAIGMLQDELQQRFGNGAELLAAIAELYIQKGAWDEAQQYIDQAMKANPDYAYPWKLQAQIYMNQENQDKTALNRALSAYQAFSDRNYSDPSGYFDRYKIFMRKNEFEKAKEELMRIFAIYPKYPSLHYYFGCLYAAQFNHKKAADEFKQELENNPSSTKAMDALGREFLDLGNFQGALELFTKVMQLEPQNSNAKLSAGWANYQLKHFQAAATLIRAAVAIDKANPLAYRRLGIVLRDMGDLNAACESFRKYLEMEPDASDRAEFKACF